MVPVSLCLVVAFVTFIEYKFLQHILTLMSYQQVIHGLVMKHSRHHHTFKPSFFRFMVSLMFALLPIKQDATYRRLFSAIFNLRPNRRSVRCIMDFEIAVAAAFTTVFHSAVISGCLFHFGQSCWLKICQTVKTRALQQ